MTTLRDTTIWRLRVPIALVRKVQRLAEREGRSTTKQAAKLLEEALNNGNPK